MEKSSMRKIDTIAEVPTTGTSLTYIGTTWCTFCKKTTEALRSVMPGLPDVQLSHVDGDDSPDILGEVGSKTYPQLLLHRDGVLIAQRESADAETLRAWLAENGVV